MLQLFNKIIAIMSSMCVRSYFSSTLRLFFFSVFIYLIGTTYSLSFISILIA